MSFLQLVWIGRQKLCPYSSSVDLIFVFSLEMSTEKSPGILHTLIMVHWRLLDEVFTTMLGWKEGLEAVSSQLQDPNTNDPFCPCI